MPRVPTLSSPSSREHAHYKGRLLFAKTIAKQLFSLAQFCFEISSVTYPAGDAHLQNSRLNTFFRILIILIIYLGVRPGTYQDFCIESQRVTPAPFTFGRQSLSAKNR